VLFTDLSGSNSDQMERLSGELAKYRSRFPDVEFASGVALLGEVLPALRRDAPLILILASLGLSLAVLVARRSLSWLVTVLVPLLLAAAISIGTLGALDIRINFYNLLVFPLAIGMGIDGAIYVAEAMERGVEKAFSTAVRSVLGATLTTVAAFAALLTARNPGLASLGKAAILTMGSTLLVNLVWLPAWIVWRQDCSAPGAPPRLRPALEKNAGEPSAEAE
jgi:predicted RND superfamily exporter protein